MASNTTPFLLNLNPIQINEPRVSNDEFLDSLDMIGVWLRVISAYDSLRRFDSPDSTAAQRLASLINIYLQLGAQLEDHAVTLIAFSHWSQNRDLVLADIFSRVLIRRQVNKEYKSKIQFVHQKLMSDDSRAVPVDPRMFFQEVVEMNDMDIVQFFLGYKWRLVPSVKLIPKQHIEVWHNLPEELRRIAGCFLDKSQIPLITAVYNKLKHGPQLIIQNPVERVKKYGNTSDVVEQLARYKSLDKNSVRLLFSGSTTQPDLKDGGKSSIAPFLVDDKNAVNKLFFETMVYQANFFSVFVKMQISLYRKQRINLANIDNAVREILEAHERYSRKRER